MNQATILLARFVRDLLVLPESVVILGRTNKQRGDTNALQVVVDQLAPASVLTDTYEFDGDAELTKVDNLMRGVFTIDFMGSTAYTIATKYMAMQRSQLAADLRRNLGINVGFADTITDVKLLSGTQYSERYQVTLNMTYNNSLAIPTNRIDTIIIDNIISDYGIESVVIEDVIIN